MQFLNIGTGPNSGTGDNLRAACSKINANFQELVETLSTVFQDIQNAVEQSEQLSSSVNSSLAAIGTSITNLNDAIQNFLNEPQINSLIDAKIAVLATKTELNNAVANLTTSTAVDTKIATAIADLITTQELATALANTITEANVDSKITTAVAGLVTQQELTDALAGVSGSNVTETFVNNQIAAAITPLATKQEVSDAVAGLINSSQLNTAIATATQDFISEAAIDIKIATATTGLASQTFVNTQISQALASYTPPVPTSIVTASGWSVAENANNNLEVKFGSSKYIEIDQTGLTIIDKLKITKNLFENIHDLGTITGTTVTVNSLNGPVQKIVVDNANVTVTPIMESGQAVTIRLSFLVDSTLVFTGVEWMDNLDPIWSTTMVNFLQLWKVDNTVYGIKIGEF